MQSVNKQTISKDFNQGLEKHLYKNMKKNPMLTHKKIFNIFIPGTNLVHFYT